MNTKRFPKQRAYIESLKQTAVVRFFIDNKRTIGIVLVIIFLALFAYYIFKHPSIITTVLTINPLFGLLIFVLYFVVILTNFVIMYVTVRRYGKTLSSKQGLLLTMYSSVVNFFGPLQSGPSVRAVYLKAKVGLRVRDYAFAMLFYYGAFAAINVAFLFINTIWWLTVIGVIATIGLMVIATRFLKRTSKRFVILTFVMTLLQIICMIIIYTTELRTIDPSAQFTILQTIAYTASANLSLFVSLTPGGIGIRETFLIFSQSLHHIGLSSIVAAGVLDRALYIIFLLLIFIVSSSLHLRQAFAQKKTV